MFKALSVESVNAVNGRTFRFRHLSRSSSERLGVRKFDIQPSHIGTRSHPYMGLGAKNPNSPKFRDFLNLFAEKRKRISANKFSNSRKYSRLFAEINSRISANIFWMPRLTRVLAWQCCNKFGGIASSEQKLFLETVGILRNICYNAIVNPAKLATATEILKNAGCSEVYLFGSQATGKANENLDVDLGVRGLGNASFFGLLKNVGELKRIG